MVNRYMSNIVDNPENYFKDLIPARDELLRELEAEAARENIPIVGPVVGELLFILAAATKAQNILEIGTATGYSAIYLARGCEAVNGRVLTLEFDSARAAGARQNFERAGLEKQISVREGDALKTLSVLENAFDLIFIDIEKKDYARALPDCGRLLRRGGLLVADNVAFEDAHEFNHMISNHPDWRAVSLFSYLPLHSPENDGLCIAIRL